MGWATSLFDPACGWLTTAATALKIGDGGAIAAAGLKSTTCFRLTRVLRASTLNISVLTTILIMAAHISVFEGLVLHKGYLAVGRTEAL
jgi:hypothetical protein